MTIASFSVMSLTLEGIKKLNVFLVTNTGRLINMAKPIIAKARYLSDPRAGIRFLYRKCKSGTTRISHPNEPNTTIEIITALITIFTSKPRNIFKRLR